MDNDADVDCIALIDAQVDEGKLITTPRSWSGEGESSTSLNRESWGEKSISCEQIEVARVASECGLSVYIIS